ncbi:hypothetical protein B0T24DRAFT_415679 [Lasiosphaeria ovina]|uniref:Uncharacterized protein n=1 Tax=Lasiosphaeria ovina TaxID=92902 RepID=A0AAE0JYV8_9PEZI|nr:hypothetical protein B0T24DRAFT_415679 [Lasiosphaeria ovina]
MSAVRRRFKLRFLWTWYVLAMIGHLRVCPFRQFQPILFIQVCVVKIGRKIVRLGCPSAQLSASLDRSSSMVSISALGLRRLEKSTLFSPSGST